MKILVIGPSWIGDMIMSHSLYRTLKLYHPQSIIDVMAPAWCNPLLSYMPEVNETILMPLGHMTFNLKQRRAIGCNLRKKYYDHAYVLPNSFKSALIPFFANIPRRTGWIGEMRYGLLNDIRVLNKSIWLLMVERYVALAYDPYVINNSKFLPKPLLWPKLKINTNDKLHISNIFGLSHKRVIIGFCPGSEFGPAKCWPYYHYAKLADQLIDHGFQILLLGSIKDHNIGNNIITSLKSRNCLWCYNLIGKTCLTQVLALISSCKLIVTNDSGLMHVAAALNKPLVALYGPSNPSFTPPLSNKARIIRFITGYYKLRKSSLNNGYHYSLLAITPQYVFEEINSLLLQIKEKTYIQCEF